MKTLGFCWRLLGTGICFASFSLGGLILSFLVFPGLSLAVRDPGRRKRISRRIVHQAFKAFTGWMELLGVLDIDLGNSREVLANCRSKIIIANHPSLIDVVVLMAEIPHADCVIKQELWQNPFFKGVLNAADYIKNSGDVTGLLESCDSSLGQGNSLIIFPEGTRTEPGQQVCFKRGAANIALRCNADIIPVFITVKPTTLTQNERWYNIPDSKVSLLLRVDRQIDVAHFQLQEQSLYVRARRLTEYLQEHYIKYLSDCEHA